MLSLVKVIWACSSLPIGRCNQLQVFAPNDQPISFSTSKTSSTLVSWVLVEAWWLGWVERSFSFFGKYSCRVWRPWPQAGRAPARKDRPSCAHCEVLHNKSAARNVLQRTEPEPAARKVLLCTVREPAARSQQPLSELTAGLPSTPNHQPCLCEAVLVLWLCVVFSYVARVYFVCKTSCGRRISLDLLKVQLNLINSQPIWDF